ncbi:hypothetical protein [Nitrosomonas eutropha]|uniref:Uncharacterized protein n=2 Tax=Nitrosomonas eutropha TaxID=916 RepID=A0ABX5M710_9PROT|nr:hypothetical protein [Nitrosomonas eutropha]ABI58648.1 hypothetical protein Neut_0368 [Nitrosomonas eutropha C91]PXV74499.1 hypothetical protein C8R14_1448 [Nitrosomonas eutropha]SEI42817.1 hypothetical protein SAMN05216318_102122 [Nitrosomonas eutropha]
MSFVRTHYRKVYSPRPIPKSLIKSLVDGLNGFKSGLPTSSRLLKAQAISHGKITNLQGSDCWKVVDPHPLAELEQVHVELLLTESDKASCEVHVEFRNEHIFLSVSDIQTGWGKSIHEEMQHLLATLGISAAGVKEKLRRAYSLLCVLQNVLLVIAVAVYSTWLVGHGESYLYGAIGLFVAGAMPALTKAFRFFFPTKRFALVQESPPKVRAFPLAEASALVALLGGILQLGKELVALLW